jgi:hypothetical protein
MNYLFFAYIFLKECHQIENLVNRILFTNIWYSTIISGKKIELWIDIYLFWYQEFENILKDNISFFLINIFEIEKYIKDIFCNSEK